MLRSHWPEAPSVALPLRTVQPRSVQFGALLGCNATTWTISFAPPRIVPLMPPRPMVRLSKRAEATVTNLLSSPNNTHAEPFCGTGVTVSSCSFRATPVGVGGPLLPPSSACTTCVALLDSGTKPARQPECRASAPFTQAEDLCQSRIISASPGQGTP